MYCAVCHTHVSPQDPEKVKKGDAIYHGGCYKNRNSQPNHCRVGRQQPKQEYFRFNVAQTAH